MAVGRGYRVRRGFPSNGPRERAATCMLSCPARECSTGQNHSGDEFVVPTPSAALRGKLFENRKGWRRLFRGDACSKARVCLPPAGKRYDV
jgi:hypothetical protein